MEFETRHRPRRAGCFHATWRSLNGDGQFSVELVKDLYGLRLLSGEWRELQSAAAGVLDFFQSYEWCEAWASRFDTTSSSPVNRKIRVFVVYGADGPVLLWPLMLVSGAMGLTYLTWLTAPYGQLGNVLVAAESDEKAAAADVADVGMVVKTLAVQRTIEADGLLENVRTQGEALRAALAR